MKFHVFSTSNCALIFKAFWIKNKPKWLPRYLMRSPFLAPIIDLGAQGDFWMHFGRLSAPFWLYFVTLGSILVSFGCILFSFGSILIPSGSAGSFCHPFRSIFVAFLNFESFLTLFLHLDCLQFRFWSHSQCKYNFGAPNVAGTHSKIIRESQP